MNSAQFGADALYPVQLTSGARVIPFADGRIETDLGLIDSPGFALLFTDATHANGVVTHIAGQAQVEPNDPRRGVWEWFAGTWRHVSQDAPGSNPVLYDANGNLLIATAAGQGSQGFRYVREDGALISGDATYNPARWSEAGFAPAVENLSEFSYLGGVFFGQADNPLGCHVVINGEHRVLLEGDTRRVWVKYDPQRDVWGVALRRLIERDAWTFLLTRADLLALPAVTQNPVITVPPVHAPEPKPEPVPMPEIPVELHDQLALVTEVRNALYPDKIGQPLNDPAKAFAITKRVAWRLRQFGVGLVKAKPGSANNVEGYTSDVVALASGVHWDTLVDGNEGAAFPAWAREENPANNPPIAARWAPAVDPGETNPEPKPEPKPADDALAKRVEALELVAKQLNSDLSAARSEIDRLEELLDGDDDTMAGFNRRLVALEHRKLRAKGGTSRAWGHAHEFDVEVTEVK
jgi:hypothetical protein